MSQAELADRAGRPKKTVNEIIKGKAPITTETALQLEKVLGIPASFWNNRERDYRAFIARQHEKENLREQTNWLSKIPCRAMIKAGWIRSFSDKVEQLEEVLSFFGVASPEQWAEIWEGKQVVFRKSKAFKSDPGAVAAWLRKGELIAQNMRCKRYSGEQFKAALRKLREITVEPPAAFQPKLEESCAQSGVAVVFVPELPKTRASGATRWLAPDKALIQLSLRYKSDDHLWFTFFHEAGHIVLHGKRSVFIEDDGGTSLEEEEANRFAANTLIPKREYQQFLSLGDFGKASVKHFARKMNVAPGIIVGRLQHDEHIPHSSLNDLKQRFVLTDE